MYNYVTFLCLCKQCADLVWIIHDQGRLYMCICVYLRTVRILRKHMYSNAYVPLCELYFCVCVGICAHMCM